MSNRTLLNSVLLLDLFIHTDTFTLFKLALLLLRCMQIQYSTSKAIKPLEYIYLFYSAKSFSVFAYAFDNLPNFYPHTLLTMISSKLQTPMETTVHISFYIELKRNLCLINVQIDLRI